MRGKNLQPKLAYPSENTEITAKWQDSQSSRYSVSAIASLLPKVIKMTLYSKQPSSLTQPEGIPIMQPNNDPHQSSQSLLSLEVDNPNINSPEFQQGYRDAYTHESQQSQHPDYRVGYFYGSKDRVLYRDC